MTEPMRLRSLTLGILVTVLGVIVACGTEPYGQTPGAGTSSGSSGTSGDPSGTSGGPGPGEGDAGTPDADAAPVGPGCNGRTDCERYVFVTSEGFDANLDGLAGADQKCQLLADRASEPLYGRRYRAWLSTRNTPASVYHPHGTKPYRLSDGRVVASDWADLVDGSLQVPISRTEKGTTFEGGVWTATNAQGEAMSANCDDWESTGGIGGARGSSAETDARWTTVGGSTGCASSLALYCFEY